ncbi:uncharacterized protein TNCV_1061221 [Trichonephila clavipes]|nr:uncharacterized protein TNCV_1061221 [Trichonephila clavipes]
MRIQLRNKLNENKLKAGNRINDLANVCILSGKRTAEVSEPVNKYRPLINPVVNKSVENATSCDFEKENCDPPFRDRFTRKKDRSTVYRLDLIKLYRRKPELENLVMKNSSEGIGSETLYSVKLFMDVGFQGNLRKSQLYFKLPPDRSSYLRMINAKKKERFLPGPKTIVLRQKDINLVTGKPFRIKTCCSSQMLINSLREDTEYLLDLGVNGMGQSNRTLPVIWLGRVNRYPYPRIKCIKYGNLNQGEGVVTSSMGVNSHLPIHNRFYGFTSWSRTRTTPIDCPWIFMINQLGVTSARGHGAVVYCLNSGSEGIVNGILETGGGWTSVSRCGQGTMASWARRLGCDLACYAPIRRRRRSRETLEMRRPRKRKKRGGDPKGEVEEKSSEKTRAVRLRKRRGESQSFDPC